MSRTTILVADDDAPVREALARILQRERHFDVHVAEDGAMALALARELRPDVVVADYAMPGLDGFALCRALRADEATRTAKVIVVSGLAEPQLKATGLSLGVDDYLAKPVDATELVARVSNMLRLKRAQDQLVADKRALEGMHGALEQSFDQVLQLLVHLIDLALPGAAARGRSLADRALALAQQFEVPQELRRDLELAALLHEIGLVVHVQLDGDRRRAGAAPDWRYSLVSRTILQDVERLAPVAELVDGIFENWDGSGFPGHRQKGQIPLRSRMLRVLIDYDGWRGRQLGTEQALARIREHAGTWYDPTVVQCAEQLLRETDGGQRAPSRTYTPVTELKEGMVLAQDLRTSSGTLLLVKGATLSSGSLEIIRRRHANDPILDGPWVREEAAA